MSDDEFLKVHLLRVGSAFAIAELERDLIHLRKRLEQEDKSMDEIAALLTNSWTAKARQLDQFFVMRDCRRIFFERCRRQSEEKIKQVLEMGPIKGTASIPWNHPDVRLKTLEELFPGFREGSPRDGGDD